MAAKDDASTGRRQDDETTDESDVGQDIDGGLSAQPKSNLIGGFDPAGGRMVPALVHRPTGGADESTDPGASSMSVVADPDANVDSQEGARDALPTESGEAAQTVGNRGDVPLPEERSPTPDDTRGRRPRGTPEMGHSEKGLGR